MKNKQNSLSNRIYKAISVTDKNWITGYYFPKNINGEIHHYLTDGIVDTEILVDTLSQFTTKFDKNKNMIFENDIVVSYVNVESEGEEFYRKGIITFVSGSFQLADVSYI